MEESFVSVQSLVVFPPFLLAIDIRDKKSLDRIESLARSEPDNPVGQQILSAIRQWMLGEARVCSTFRDWLEEAYPDIYQELIHCYKIEKVPTHGNKKRQAVSPLPGGQIPGSESDRYRRWWLSKGDCEAGQ
jgi:hypothetical protein